MARSSASAAVLAAALALASAACGGIASVPGQPGAGGSAGQTGTDGGSGADAGADAGWTQCSAPDGLRLCKGINDCQPSDDQHCVCKGADDAGPGVCELWFAAVPDRQRYFDSCGTCPDGDICAAWLGGDTFFCAPYEAGVLYANNGAPDRVRYADLGLWTGDPLPTPATCPDLGFPICGGNCGACPSGVCTGRSPLHPYGLCVPANPQGGQPNGGCGGGTCPSGWGCFTYKVEPAAQAVADEYSFCLPASYCKSAAANLPGGGKCSAP